MNNNTPIVFVHYGKSWYLPYVLNQAKSASPSSQVVLIGDDVVYDKIQIIPLRSLHNECINLFQRQYQHMSSNTLQYELFCWTRWFYLLEYMRRAQLDDVLHLDSDVLLFSNLSDARKGYGDRLFEGGLMVPDQVHDTFYWVASGHVSYWTQNLLEEYCEFCISSFNPHGRLDQYLQKWDWHLTNKTTGGICDMTTLYLFWKERQERIINLAEDCAGGVFDLAMCTGDNYRKNEYVTRSGRKIVAHVEGHPCFRKNDPSNRWIRVHSMHFQGVDKNDIRRYYSGMGFKGKTYQETMIRLRSIKRCLGSLKSRLLIR